MRQIFPSVHSKQSFPFYSNEIDFQTLQISSKVLHDHIEIEEQLQNRFGHFVPSSDGGRGNFWRIKTGDLKN